MKSQKKTLIDVKRRRIQTYHIGLAAIAVFALYAGFSASFDAKGVIPLSTRIPSQELEPQLQLPQVELPSIQQPLEQPMEQPQQQAQVVPSAESDADLLHLLRSSVIEDAENSQWKVVRMRVTAYCTCHKCCGKYSAYGRTANMHKVRQGDVFVAADKRIPFGTEMIIPGYNQERPVEVKDRGRLIKGNRLDVFFNNHKVAKKWGTRYLDVLVKVED